MTENRMIEWGTEIEATVELNNGGNSFSLMKGTHTLLSREGKEPYYDFLSRCLTFGDGYRLSYERNKCFEEAYPELYYGWRKMDVVVKDSLASECAPEMVYFHPRGIAMTLRSYKNIQYSLSTYVLAPLTECPPNVAFARTYDNEEQACEAMLARCKETSVRLLI